jgi:hypothetical protein
MSLILPSEEIEAALLSKLETIAPSEKEEWLLHPVTEAIGILYELVRMHALEQIEAGCDPTLAQELRGQAILMRDMRENLAATVRQKREETDESDPTSWSQDTD